MDHDNVLQQRGVHFKATWYAARATAVHEADHTVHFLICLFVGPFIHSFIHSFGSVGH